nr:hypothetical protein [uncultured Acetobacterium sp.]
MAVTQDFLEQKIQIRSNHGCGQHRHGIILAKNVKAKKAGVKTGEALWQARSKCPDLVIVPPNYERYLRYSKLSRKIYNRYSDQVEPFGLDESWISVTNSVKIHGSGEEITQKISREIQDELGVWGILEQDLCQVWFELQETKRHYRNHEG